MAPAIVERIPDIPDQKRQKLEDDENDDLEDDDDMSGESELSYDDEDIRLFDAEYERSGDYDFDFSRVRYHVGFRPVNFEKCRFADEPETDGDLIGKMCIAALKKYNEDEKTSLEFATALRANWNLAAGIAFCISLQAKDASSDRIVPFHARVRYLVDDFIVSYVKPKPLIGASSSQEEIVASSSQES